MYELHQVGPMSYYLESPAKIGIYRPEGSDEVYLIDSGSDKDAGRRTRKVLDEQGWRCRGILVTHSNADHVGGCAYLQKQYDCPVFSGGIEGAITAWPEMEPAFLYGGYPYKELRHKFLMAQPCEVTPITDPAFPGEVTVLSLPGHFFQQVGFLLPDGTAFIADCLSSQETIEKYRVGFIYDVAAYLDTLRKLPELGAKVYVPSHAAVTEDIAPLANVNIAATETIAEDIVKLCGEGTTWEELLYGLFDAYGMEMTHQQYVLIGSTVRSYLSYLKESGRIAVAIEDNRVVWRAV